MRAQPVTSYREDSDTPDAIGLGRYCHPETGDIGERLRWKRYEGVLILGPPGTGKDTSIIDPLLLQNRGASIVVVDIKGEGAAKTAPFRRTISDVHIINPCGLLVDVPGYADLRSKGFNPLLGIDPSPHNPNLIGQVRQLANVLIEQPKNNDANVYFSIGAANLVALAIVKELLDAKAEGRTPGMARVRALICTPSGQGASGKVYGWPAFAADIIARCPIPELKNIAGAFLHWQDDVRSIQGTAIGQTESLDDRRFANDMEGVTFDVRDIKRKPTTVYLMIPADELAEQGRWLRMLISKMMRAVMRERRPGEPRVIFVLNEAYVLGRIEVLRKVWNLTRGYGVTAVTAWQSLTQIQSVWGEKETQSIITSAGVIAAFRPGDMTTATYLSNRCGDTTVVAHGYNESQQQNPNSTGSSNGLSLTQTKVPAMKPHDLFGLGQGYMVQFVQGSEANYIPAYAPPYWLIAECNNRARANPYHTGGQGHAGPYQAPARSWTGQTPESRPMSIWEFLRAFLDLFRPAPPRPAPLPPRTMTAHPPYPPGFPDYGRNGSPAKAVANR